MLFFNGKDGVIATPANKISFVPNNTTEACGTEDPRISECNGTYYLFYTAYDCSKAMLSLATTTDPKDPNGWTRHGYVLPNIGWSKSGAALWADGKNGLTQHYLFWGDGSNPADGIGIATSQDGIHWDYKDEYLIKTRKDKFDSNLIESGPSPMRLSTGDYLFIYNSARNGYPSVKGNWDLQYNIGFLILDGEDPIKIKQRSDEPIMAPELVWEIGNSTEYLTPNVVFLEGMVRSPDACKESADCFFAVYGGSDSATGAVKITVTYDNYQDTMVIITKE